MIPLAHPSPRNTLWLRRNPWHEQELLPSLRERIATVLARQAVCAFVTTIGGDASTCSASAFAFWYRSRLTLRRAIVELTRHRAVALAAGRCRGHASRVSELGLLLHSSVALLKLNLMVQFMAAHLDASFAALADPTRRGVLERLGRSDASITELADTFRMTLTGMKKHIGVLELAGLVVTEKAGRVRTCRLGPRRLEDVSTWIEKYRQLWSARFDELDLIAEELKRAEIVNQRNKRK